jgi:hypothetical protein
MTDKEKEEEQKTKSGCVTFAILLLFGVPAGYFIWAILQTF